MSLPNSQDKEPTVEDGGQNKGDVSAPAERPAASPVAPADETCLAPNPPASPAGSSATGASARTARWYAGRPFRALLAGGAATVLCVVGAIVLLRGCGRHPAIPPTPQMGIEARFWVRVLLLNDKSDCTIEIPSAFRIVSGNRHASHVAGGAAREPLPGPTKISLVAGRLMLGTEPLTDKEVVFSPEQPCIFGLDRERFRGRLELIVNDDGQSFDAINLVPLEPYLAGVVGREMKDDWKPQALEAQAIAARTYCLFMKNDSGTKRSYDVRRTQASQVYGGVQAESPQIWEAVNRTCGQILMEPGLVAERDSIADCGPGSKSGLTTLRIADSTRGGNPQSYKLFPTYYSSTCGGHTTRSDQVLGGSYGPLQGVSCPYCKDAAPLATFYWPTATFDRKTVTKQLLKKYPNLVGLGEITEIAVIGESCYESFSRLTRIRVTGITGKTDTLRAEDLRLSLDPSGLKIKSTACRIVPWGDGWAFISGRGWGHGVGMCQYGVKRMAELGHDVWTILRYYYPGAEIVNVY